MLKSIAENVHPYTTDNPRNPIVNSAKNTGKKQWVLMLHTLLESKIVQWTKLGICQQNAGANDK